ncbi:hypothetical protein ML462_10540 [Gramella lutea]|uniref:Uncharacterized protein n=1 Tax=Christiangramia lutea TaxID=1607951 RepID=A0A9X1V345_9FLAO|nr:hypothetical protein [Christiangramia lutea]MCH4823607.1 hypothetical protein [Christiangramia lutea]
MSQLSQNSPAKWALYIFISGIPLVGIIMLLVWGFGSDNNISRKNWAKGMLLIYLLIIIFYIIFMFFLGGAAILNSMREG